MTSKPTLIQLINQLEQYLVQLKELQKYSLENFRDDWKIYQLVDHSLHLAIENTVDIGKIIVIENRFRKPRTYKETFDILKEEKVIPSSLAEELKLLAEFRNQLIHDYLFTDLDEIYNVYQGHLWVFIDFLKIVREILKQERR